MLLQFSIHYKNNVCSFMFVCASPTAHPCQRIRLSIPGPASFTSGIYVIMKTSLPTPSPVYSHECLPLYLYLLHLDQDSWVIGSEVGSRRVYVMSLGEIHHFGTAHRKWKFWNNLTQSWTYDMNIYSQCLGNSFLNS